MKTARDNMSLGAAGIAEGTGANTFQIANITHYVIAGRAYRKAITDNIAMAAFSGTSFVALGNNQVCALFVMINAAGTVTLLQSSVKTASTGSGYVPGAFEWPGDIDGFACIGALRVTTGAAGTFTPGATDLSAAGVTGQYHDVAVDYGKPVTY
jgi:hypothetical protein